MTELFKTESSSAPLLFPTHCLFALPAQQDIACPPKPHQTTIAAGLGGPILDASNE